MGQKTTNKLFEIINSTVYYKDEGVFSKITSWDSKNNHIGRSSPLLQQIGVNLIGFISPSNLSKPFQNGMFYRISKKSVKTATSGTHGYSKLLKRTQHVFWGLGFVLSPVLAIK